MIKSKLYCLVILECRYRKQHVCRIFTSLWVLIGRSLHFEKQRDGILLFAFWIPKGKENNFLTVRYRSSSVAKISISITTMETKRIYHSTECRVVFWVWTWVSTTPTDSSLPQSLNAMDKVLLQLDKVLLRLQRTKYYCNWNRREF